ncbi:hypothetical protein [Luteimonas kalidii]|uniref:Lipoprotein n=1 Tax=Luteimonas kalidii TaxID=3042025 RepID=A0ABT6JTY2_9GAMM|nr:hypothetical protein [Luteimonas kalidii]MDH5833406.1 hypothetical protein [Luteimonas kalidii]
MNRMIRGAAILAALLLSACATHQDVLLAKSVPPPIVTVAAVASDGNSPEMDASVRNALIQNGFSVQAPLPAGTRTSDQVDALVTYVDVWRWDIVMYLQSVAIKLFDARTGDLLVTGDWKNSAFHGYQDEDSIVRGLITDMATRLKTATPSPAAAREAADAQRSADAAKAAVGE